MFVLCHDFAERGPNSTVAQTNTSFNYTRGTLRGLHRRMPRRPYVAHGFQTLANKTEVVCQASGRCKPAGVIYRIAGTNLVWVVGVERRR